MKKTIAVLAAGLLALSVATPPASAQNQGLPGVLGGTGLTAGMAAGILGGLLVLGVVASNNNNTSTTTSTK